MTNLFLIYCCFWFFQCANCSQFSGFYDVPDIVDRDDGMERDEEKFRTPIIQYISTPPFNYTFPKIGFFNMMSTRNFDSGDLEVQVSSRGNQNLAYEVLLVYTMLHQSSIIANLSIPFKYNDIEYYFGTDRDLSNYSSLPYRLICEYPMVKYIPGFYGKFYAIEPFEPVTRVFFGCKSSENNSCCGMECCANLSVIDILKTCMYFIGVIIFLIVVCQQISLCDKRAQNKCAKFYETI